MLQCIYTIHQHIYLKMTSPKSIRLERLVKSENVELSLLMKCPKMATVLGALKPFQMPIDCCWLSKMKQEKKNTKTGPLLFFDLCS